MIKRITSLVILIAVVLTAKAQFGSYSHDLPFMGSSEASKLSISVDIYEWFSFNTNSITNNVAYGAFGRETVLTPNAPSFPAKTTGVSDGGLLFDGSDAAQALNFNNTNNAYRITFYGTNSWSVAMWLDIDRETTNTSTTPLNRGDTIFSLWRNLSPLYQAVVLGYTGEDTDLALRVRQNVSQWVRLPIFPIGSQMTNGWFHLAFGYDGTLPGLWFQTNAGPRQTAYVTNAIAPFWVDGSHAVSFGNVSDGSRTFKGKMDEVGIWGRLLTTNEVSQLYGFQTNALVYGPSWSDQFTSNNPAPDLFGPNTISDLVFAVDALRPWTLVNTANVTAPTNGSIITNWHNIRITNTIAFSKHSTVSVMPRYYTNGAGTNADKPRLFFTNNAAMGALVTASPSNTTNTYVMVHDYAATLGGRIYSATTDSGGQIGTDNPSKQWWIYAGGWFGGFPAAPTNYVVSTFVFEPGNHIFRTNGVPVSTNTAANSTAMNVGVLGATVESGSAKYFWNANISRIYRWGRKLTTNELQQVEDACRREYGI